MDKRGYLESIWADLADKLLREVDARIESAVGGIKRGGKVNAATLAGTIPLASLPTHTHEGGAANLTVAEIDGNPSAGSVSYIKVTNGKLTDNGGGTVTLDLAGGTASGGGGGTISITEIDGTPSVAATVLEFPNGTLSDQGGGTARYTPAAGSGALDANNVLLIPSGTAPTAPVADTALVYADALPSLTNAIPTMTSDTAPSGVCSASSYYSSTPVWKAFDGGASTGWITNAGGVPCWIGYQFPSAKRIIAYSFRPWWTDNYPARTPKTWKFQGSTDNSTWVDLDSQTDWTPTSSALYFKFNCPTPNSYTYFRLYITANQGANAYTGVGGLRMFEAGTNVGLYVMDEAGGMKSLSA